MTKLTLSVEEEIVEQAKRLAEANRTSVSAMFSRFIQSMANPRADQIKIGPVTRKLSGILQLPPEKDYKELLAEALEDKYRTAK
jgi:hypothetical protein